MKQMKFEDILAKKVLYTFITLITLYVNHMGGTPESPLPLNPGQGSDSRTFWAKINMTQKKGLINHIIP